MSHQDLTLLLGHWHAGSARAEADLLPLVYRELRRIAARELRRERPNHTLQPTALVHELYLELKRSRGLVFESRREFFGFAAHLARRVLVAHARHRQQAKRGGALRPVGLAEAGPLPAPTPAPDLVALDDALGGLWEVDPVLVRIVELRYFVGLTLDETAEVLGVSAMTVSRGWQRARAWLFEALSAPMGAPLCKASC